MLGHNSGNFVSPDDLASRHTALVERARELADATKRMPTEISDADMAGKLADFTKQLNACVKKIDDARKEEKQPFLDATRAVDAWFKQLSAPVEMGRDAAVSAQTRYLRKIEDEERARRKAEAEALAAKAKDSADLEAAIAAEKLATVKPAEISRTRGDYGAVVSLRTTLDFEITDRASIDLEALRPYLTTDALTAAIRQAIKAGVREIKGVSIFESKKAITR